MTVAVSCDKGSGEGSTCCVIGPDPGWVGFLKREATHIRRKNEGNLASKIKERNGVQEKK